MHPAPHLLIVGGVTLGVLIMAAGRSSRFEGCKLLADYQNKPLLQHTIEQAMGLESEKLTVITGYWHKEIEAAQQQGQISEAPLLYNSDWAQGLGCSIAFGVSQLQDSCDSLLILLADQVQVLTEDLHSLTRKRAGSQITCAFYAGKRGVPAIFHRDCFEELMSLDGEHGAKALLNSDRYRTVNVDMPHAEQDIDSKNDLTTITDYRSR